MSDPSTEIRTGPDSEMLVRRVLEIIEGTRALPLSSSVRLDNKDEVVELLEESINRLPEEVKAARWLLKERDEYLAGMQREADQIVETGTRRAEEMVENTEIVRQARHAAQRIVDEAEEDARRLRRETEDYCDHKLAQFEVVLDRTTKIVQAGRQKLTEIPGGFDAEGRPLPEIGEETLGGDDAFFDQDRTR